MINPATLAAMQQLGLPTQIDYTRYDSLLDVFEHVIKEHGDKPAFSCLGHTLSFKQFGEQAKQFAAYLQQHTELQAGDRVAIQLPNILQYPVLLFGVLLADLVVVNTNPLYTARELKHQLNDSGAKLLIVLKNVASAAQEVVPETAVEQVLLTELADFHPAPKRLLINAVVKYIKRLVPKLDFAKSISLREAMALGKRASYKPVQVSNDHLAVLQYTGGTTGLAKGAMLSHGNILANILQCEALFGSYGMTKGQETVVVPLPLYHIYSFTVCMVMVEEGSHCILIPNPRDLSSLVKAIKRYGMTFFCGLNTLFVALCHDQGFKQLDFSRLKLTLSGGMALTEAVAKLWQQTTGCEVHQGYGLTETSPVISANPGGGNKTNTIGLPLADTELVVMSEQGEILPIGEQGELCMRGPQLMKGYWQQPEETAKVIDAQGWFHTGDIGILDPDGYHRVVDRKKDMILVSGFNVYPNEIEAVLSEHPGVLECAAIGIPDDTKGERIQMYVVLKDKSLKGEQLKGFCKSKLAGYKVPSEFIISEELPKSAVGKILRRELRDKAIAAATG
ncbi:AMP-binding protein [Dasania sp. GY-MA-18]|uniref:Long-chain-fatty-acid--CoA ligase n=1 Tax=Dasania phycosphaerae TaxID=2950436 RepID=A0A9J6RN75_9GAMM|nr:MULTISPECIES: AMP-binding protein [Dasania]MCR8923545.1 AMP-binding protein [Dasania sp. GY-MA-18]MCZ0865979.1 AMP-binding protein [Dasania phycosphaerae]MCZ0869703.1 AMP-binding protein [Dasania phycosphaerae]